MSPQIPIILSASQLRWSDERGSWLSEPDWAPGVLIEFSMADEHQWARADPAMLAEIGTAFLRWAKEFEPQCREQIAVDLFDVYNRSWADDDSDEGPPKLTR